MTLEEAHRILSNGLVNAPSEHEWCMAFDVAIKALEQQDKILQILDDYDLEAWEILEMIKEAVRE